MGVFRSIGTKVTEVKSLLGVNSRPRYVLNSVKRSLSTDATEIPATDTNFDLYSASWHGNIEHVKSRLVESNVDVGAFNSDGVTALQLAVFNMHTEVVDLLVSASPDVNIVSKPGFTALHIAIFNNDTEMINALLNAGADPYIQGTLSPFHLAIALGDTGFVNLHFGHGEDTIISQSAFSPLQCAAFYGQHGVLSTLLKGGADLKKTDKAGRIALHFAAMTGSVDIIETLLSQNAKDSNAMDHDGHTPLHYLGGRLRKAEKSQYDFPWPAFHPLNHIEKPVAEELLCAGATALIRAGANLVTKDRAGMTALSYSAYRGYAAVMTLFINHGADVCVPDMTGAGPLSHAADGGYGPAIQLILDKGGSVKARSHRSWTALFYAARNGHATAIKVLADAGAEIDARDNDGCTPLFYAMRSRSRDAMKTLLKLGADKWIRNKDGLSTHQFQSGLTEAEGSQYDWEIPRRPIIATTELHDDVAQSSTIVEPPKRVPQMVAVVEPLGQQTTNDCSDCCVW
jgi:ankyrin repeat protein